MRKIRNLFVIVLLALPLLLIAQEATGNTVSSAMQQNTGITSMIAQLLPMGINPYATIFLTSVFSKIGLENEYVATNPFFDSWFVLLIFGALFLFTALVGTVVKTNKATAAIGLADNYLSGHASIIINIFVVLAPTFFTAGSEDEIIQQAGFLSIGLKTILVLIASIYFLVVISSVRFFIDILIFLSPVPLIDSILEIAKIVVAIFFVFLGAVFPTFTAIISVLIFLCCLLMYKRSMRLVNNTKYLFIYPILGFFKKDVELDVQNFSIRVYIKKKTKKFNKGTIVKLINKEGKLFLVKERFLVSDIEEELDLLSCFIKQEQLSSKITNEQGSILILLNRTYYRQIPVIAKILNIPIEGKKVVLKLNSGKKSIKNLKQMFNSDDHKQLKASL